MSTRPSGPGLGGRKLLVPERSLRALVLSGGLALLSWQPAPALGQTIGSQPASTAAPAPSAEPARGAGPEPSAEPSAEPTANAEPEPSAASTTSTAAAPAGHAAAAEPSAAPTASSRPSLLADLDPATLLSRGLDAERELDAIEARVDRSLDTRDAVAFVTTRAGQIERDALAAYERVGSARRWSTIVDLRYRYATLKEKLEHYRQPLTASSELVTKSMKRVATLRADWTAAKRTLTARGEPSELTDRASDIVVHAGEVEKQLDERVARLTRVSADLDELIRLVDEVLDSTEQNSTGILRDYHVRGPYPWQQLGRLPSPREFTTGLAARVPFLAGNLAAFASEHPVHLLCTLLTWALMALWIRNMHRDRIEQERTSLSYPAQAITPLPHHTIHNHPIPAGALAATVVGLNGVGTLPAAASLVLLGMAVIAAASLLLAQGDRTAVRLGAQSLVLYGFVAATFLVDDFDALTSLLLLPEAVIVGYVAFRTALRPVFKLTGAWAATKGLVSRAWFAIVVIGVLAWLAGYEVVASVCIEGTTRTLLLAIVVQSVYTALTAALSAVLHSDLGRKSLAVASHRTLIQANAEYALRIYLVYRWIVAMLEAYTLRRDVEIAFTEWMASPVKVGSVEFSVGSGLTLVLGVILAVVVARLLRFVLEAELLPRTGLRTGTTAAIGSGTYFVAVSAGVFLTIAAAGMHLDKLAIVVSALGVGIGFGLQNIVQNFVAGLILLFGRPINVGDVVEVKDLTGQVTAVGARASTIRTFQGAEVIVPNSFFISDQVINWTLSDETRRIDLDIGVAYGAEPERVIALLKQAVKSHQHVLSTPPVNVLFTGFGDSALNYQVRVWTKRSDIWVDIKSDLGIAMNRALREAGISIPFPQRDVYLHTVSTEKPAAEALPQGSATEPPNASAAPDAPSAPEESARPALPTSPEESARPALPTSPEESARPALPGAAMAGVVASNPLIR